MTDRRSLGGREFEIMVTMVSGPKHGYAIMQEIREQETGSRVLGPGTLYRVLKDLVGRGLIAVVDTPGEESDGPPRRIYRLTAPGQRLVAAEARRLSGLVKRAEPLLRSEPS